MYLPAYRLVGFMLAYERSGYVCLPTGLTDWKIIRAPIFLSIKILNKMHSIFKYC